MTISAESASAKQAGAKTVIKSVATKQGLKKSDPIGLASSAALLFDKDSNRVLFQKNADSILPIASITKLMTAIVVLDAKQPMDELIPIGTADMDTVKNTHSRLRIGISLTRKQLLHIALMSSENSAAHTLCRHYPGGESACLANMNRRAKQIGMSSTNFTDPTGLTYQNQSTAHDLSILVAKAAEYDIIRQFSTSIEETVIVNNTNLYFRTTNNLVKKQDWQIAVQKTGFIAEAGFCLVLETKVTNRNIIMVFLDANSVQGRIADAERARSWLTKQPINKHIVESKPNDNKDAV